MPRTTLMIDDSVFRAIRQKAAAESRTMQAIVNDLLRQALNQRTSSTGYRLRLKGWDGKLQPGVAIDSNARLLDIMEGL